MNWMKKREKTEEEVAVNKKDLNTRGGLCCPHCSDSKFPCVTMERMMRRGEKEKSEEVEEKKAE